MQLQEQLQGMMEADGLSLNAVSKALGISASALSQWLSRSYKGNVERIDEAVAGYLERQKERSASPRRELPFVMTSVAEKIHEVLRQCHLEGEMGVVFGQSGLGKTWACREYVKRNTDTIMIEVDDRCAKKNLFIRALHRALGFDGSGRPEEMLEGIVSKLSGSGRCLIVDEAEKLPYKTLEAIRRLWDFTGIGIVLVGMPQLVANLRGKKGEYMQLYSRIFIPCQLESLQPEDGRLLTELLLPGANGISRVFWEESNGNTRVLTKLALRTARVAEINGKAVTAALIKTVRKAMIV
ncbi:MAG: ATPase [Calditrichia bacterium]